MVNCSREDIIGTARIEDIGNTGRDLPARDGACDLRPLGTRSGRPGRGSARPACSRRRVWNRRRDSSCRRARRPHGRAVGLDLNPEMLAAARASSPPAIEWYEGSVVSLPFPDGAFDVVLCQQGLQFFPDRAVALGEMRRVLGPGGRLAVSVWRSIDHQPGYQPLERALAKRVGPEKAALPPFGFGDRASLRAAVSGAGFQNVRVRAEVKTVRFASAEHMVRALVGGAPTMLAAFAQQGETVLATIVDEVTKELADYVDDEGLGFPAVSHIATALR